MPDFTIAYIVTIFAHGAAVMGGSDLSIHMMGEDNITGVKAIIEDDAVFIFVDDILERLDISIKEIGDGTIGLCKDELCVIVQLDNAKDARFDSGKLMINADLIAQTLSSEVEWLVSGKVLRFAPGNQTGFDTVVEVGDVLPDFALPSIADGKMIPFSSFRGKRVLLFLWASW